MTSRTLLAAAALVAASALAPAAMAEGPKLSSENYIAVLPADAPPAGALPAPVMLGPKAASSNNIPAEPVIAPSGTPHYVWETGYEPAGKWRGHWVLVP